MTMEIQHLMWRIGGVFDDFNAAVYVRRDLDAALALAEPEATFVHLPVQTGTGPGRDLRRHLTDDVLPHLPADLAFRRVARTADQRRLVQESVVTFTHDRELPWLLPGIALTHRRADVLTVASLRVKHRSRLGTTTTLMLEQRVLWDLASLLAQLGLSTFPVPVAADTVVAGRS